MVLVRQLLHTLLSLSATHFIVIPPGETENGTRNEA